MHKKDEIEKLFGTPNYSKLNPETYITQYRSLSALRYVGKRAYNKIDIDALILSPFSETSVPTVIAHYNEWIEFGLTPQNILFIVRKYNEEGIKLLKNPVSVEKKLLNIMHTSSLNELKGILHHLHLTLFSLVKFLLKDNEVKHFEALSSLIFWTRSTSDESGHTINRSRILGDILVFLGVQTEQLIIIMSNIGIQKSIEVLTNLMPLIEKRLIQSRKFMRFAPVLAVLNLTVERFMFVLVNVDNLRGFTILESLFSWVRSSPARAFDTKTSKDALIRILAILGITIERLVAILLADNGAKNLNILKQLYRWIKSFNSPKEDFSEILVILQLEAEQLIKLLVDIDKPRSFNILEKLIQWVKKLSEDSSSAMTPKDVLNRIFTISGLDLNQLIIKGIECRSEEKIELFRLGINQIVTGCSSNIQPMTLFEPRSSSEKKLSRKRKAQKAALDNESLHRSPNFSSNYRLDFFSGSENKRRLTENNRSLTEDELSMAEFVEYWGKDEEDDEKEIYFAHSSVNGPG